MKDERLKNCPFCGCFPKVTLYHMTVDCENCGIHDVDLKTWQTRAESAKYEEEARTLRRRVDELEDALLKINNEVNKIN